MNERLQQLAVVLLAVIAIELGVLIARPQIEPPEAAPEDQSEVSAQLEQINLMLSQLCVVTYQAANKAASLEDAQEACVVQ